MSGEEEGIMIYESNGTIYIIDEEGRILEEIVVLVTDIEELENAGIL